MKNWSKKIIHLLSKSKYLLSLLNFIYESLPNSLIVKIEPIIRKPNFDYTWKIKMGKKKLYFTFLKGENRTVFHFPLSYKKNDFGIRKLEILLNSHYPQEKIYLDIGANYGLRSLYYASMGRKCILFEPNSNCIEITKRLIKENSLLNVEVINCVVGNETTNVKFHLSKNTYLSSLSKAHSENYNDYLKTIDMKMIRIDDFLDENGMTDQVSLFKIDVEGFELDVLKGSINLLKNNNVTLIIEVLESALERMEIFNFLKLLGYQMFGILKSYNRIRLTQCNENFPTSTIDFICSKDEKFLQILKQYSKK